MQGNMRKEEDDDGGFAVESQNLAQGGFGKGVGGGGGLLSPGPGWL